MCGPVNLNLPHGLLQRTSLDWRCVQVVEIHQRMLVSPHHGRLLVRYPRIEVIDKVRLEHGGYIRRRV